MSRRVIFLVDMNAFYISCEQLRRPELRGVPAAVAGNPLTRTGVILAANYEARACGVRTAMTLHQARNRCPRLETVPPDRAYYEHKSREVIGLLGRFSPLIEQNSIDEAWLDMTGSERLFGAPGVCAKRLMATIEAELGLWCSIGISENKFLAKMAAGMKKPRGITELWPADLPGRFWPLPVHAMYGVGAKTAERLRGIGIETVGDLAHTDVQFLFRMLGKSGELLHAHANGIDDTPVKTITRDDLKQIGRSVTLPHDVDELEEARRVLMQLCDEVGMTVRKNDKKGRVVQITLKYTDFTSVTRQCTIPATWTTQEIYDQSYSLLKQNWNVKRPIRLLGVAVSGFEESGDGAADPARQLSLFEVGADPMAGDARPCEKTLQSRGREQQLEAAMDRIRKKMGADAIGRAALLEPPPVEPADADPSP